MKNRDPITGTLANSEYPDEMPHYAAFHQGLHCLLRQNQSSEKEIYCFEIIIFDPSISAMDLPVSNFMGNSSKENELSLQHSLIDETVQPV